MGRVLVVDDDDDACEVMRRMLVRRGHTVAVARDGWRALSQIAAARPQPDLVILDWAMPKLSGGDVLAAIQGDPAFRDLRVVIFSCGCDYERVECASRLGAIDYIVKGSASWADVLRRLEEYIDAPPGTSLN